MLAMATAISSKYLIEGLIIYFFPNLIIIRGKKESDAANCNTRPDDGLVVGNAWVWVCGSEALNTATTPPL